VGFSLQSSTSLDLSQPTRTAGRHDQILKMGDGRVNSGGAGHVVF